MNESLFLRFASPTGPLTVADFRDDLGLLFDHYPDASPLNFALGVLPVLPSILNATRARHDWRDGGFFLEVGAEAGGLLFSGFKGDKDGFPPGPYDLTVELESYRFTDAEQRLVVHDGQAAAMTVHVVPDLRRVRLREWIDSQTAAVIGNSRSVVDGVPLASWLTSNDPRAVRQACLLNIIAKLRVPPDSTHGFPDPITPALDFVFFADVDRIYAALRPDLQGLLDRLVKSGLWVREGRPAAAIHQLLLQRMSGIGVPDSDKYSLISYRQGGRNCLQVVLAVPPNGSGDTTVYGDIDIDLGNPLWDVEGLFVHIGELLDPGKTDHFVLRSKLAKGPAKPG